MDSNPKPSLQDRWRERQTSPPGKAAPLSCGIAQRIYILGTSLTHCHLGGLKFYAPDVSRIIAVSALAQLPSTPPHSPKALSHMGLCKGKTLQMTLQSYLVNLWCYSEYPWVWSSLELCSGKEKKRTFKMFSNPLISWSQVCSFWFRGTQA